MVGDIDNGQTGIGDHSRRSAAGDQFPTRLDEYPGEIDDPIFRGFGPSGAGRTDDCIDPVLE